jgi:hypothetical protein
MIIASVENSVDVYQFTTYSGMTDSVQKSRRYGTKDAIERIAKGTVLFDTKCTVDRSIIEPPNTDIPGLTQRDFHPDAHTGFQTRVV